MDGFTSFLGPSSSSFPREQHHGGHAQEGDILLSHDSPEEHPSYYSRIQGHFGGVGNAGYRPSNRQVSPNAAPAPSNNTHSNGTNVDKLTRSQLSLEDFQWQDNSMEQTDFHSSGVSQQKKEVSWGPTTGEEAPPLALPEETQAGNASPNHFQNSTAGATPYYQQGRSDRKGAFHSSAEQTFLTPSWRGGQAGQEEVSVL